MKYFILVTLFLVSCSRDVETFTPSPMPLPSPQPSVSPQPTTTPTPSPSTPPVVQGPLYQLFLFAATHCGPCKEELPILQKWHNNYIKKNKVITTVYVIAGNPPSTPITQPAADAFKAELKLDFKTVADRFGKVYKNFYPTDSRIPATVLLDGAGKVVHIFAPGKVTGADIEKWVN